MKTELVRAILWCLDRANEEDDDRTDWGKHNKAIIEQLNRIHEALA